jgi:hypothetical protein
VAFTADGGAAAAAAGALTCLMAVGAAGVEGACATADGGRGAGGGAGVAANGCGGGGGVAAAGTCAGWAEFTEHSHPAKAVAQAMAKIPPMLLAAMRMAPTTFRLGGLSDTTAQSKSSIFQRPCSRTSCIVPAP